jgi:PilZ domain
MPDVMVERRAAPRYPLILGAEVTVLSNKAKLQARTSDVSRTGCYIDTLNPCEAGTQIHLRLDYQSESFEALARVVYISPGLGMGVAFQGEIPPAQLAILDRWLAAAANPNSR